MPKQEYDFIPLVAGSEDVSWDQDAGNLTMGSDEPTKLKASTVSKLSTEGASGAGMGGTKSMAPAHQRAHERSMTPEEMMAWADGEMDKLHWQAAMGEGQAERRYAGASDRSAHNALSDGAEPKGPNWLDQYMETQRR